MKKILLVCMIVIFSHYNLLADEYYGIKMLSTLKDINTYEKKGPTKDSPKSFIYEKKLKDNFFNTLRVETDLNNKVYKIILLNDDNYRAQEMLNKLEKEYGNFTCSNESNIVYRSTICTKSYNDVKIYISSTTSMSYISLSVIYESNKIADIRQKDEAQKKKP